VLYVTFSFFVLFSSVAQIRNYCYIRVVWISLVCKHGFDSRDIWCYVTRQVRRDNSVYISSNDRGYSSELSHSLFRRYQCFSENLKSNYECGLFYPLYFVFCNSPSRFPSLPPFASYIYDVHPIDLFLMFNVFAVQVFGNHSLSCPVCTIHQYYMHKVPFNCVCARVCVRVRVVWFYVCGWSVGIVCFSDVALFCSLLHFLKFSFNKISFTNSMLNKTSLLIDYYYYCACPWKHSRIIDSYETNHMYSGEPYEVIHHKQTLVRIHINHLLLIRTQYLLII
jgi:hypothetical protein